MGWSASHKQDTRNAILDAAAGLFTRYGYEQVGVNQVMEAAGLTRGAFYAHFKSKAALYAEAIPHAARRAQQALLDSLPERPDRQSMINGYLSETHRRGETLGCPLAFLTTDVSQRDPEVRAAYTHVFRGFIEQFSKTPEKRQAAIKASVLMIGGMAIARALDDEDLVKELFEVCRKVSD
ncbi:TetR/AcrR family transcriptional regulator [Simiduia agarivorans]|uniref:Transcriptional regulator n=1 Tax=Simiduia agarivorans (strain DSM 21679 / JCM 13881 / BCRC 17597 / SA1) TaxID=1117647 RepID=K4L0Z4_SIMAS|nr:TetR/AcrR family transcriptional regulator [Simiduia agarivorans]AFU99837.1 transcriptional regulator [Simiduia agarivorans SA1 = DSM 21679]